ncbi:hypothetical protein PI124_g5960 [Phytophthora idaei]|nr:hypothetical protein PI125_g15922 [Phytophthora idaei]KAG3143272.1 hypothetical protein PI126_g14705 [Phytophthora idaei]KAG3249368.1 hypothetical protein PI124_g5960 [Phytophthora idaei]
MLVPFADWTLCCPGRDAASDGHMEAAEESAFAAGA